MPLFFRTVHVLKTKDAAELGKRANASAKAWAYESRRNWLFWTFCIRIPFITLLLGGLGCSFLLMMNAFIVSEEWYNFIKPFVLPILGMSFLYGYFLGIWFSRVAAERIWHPRNYGFLMLYLALLSTIFGVPVSAGILFGDQTAITYVVERANSPGDSKCRRPIEFEGMPIFLDRLCGAQEAFQSNLSPGDSIAIVGRGTTWGVFKKSAHKIE